MRCDCGSEATIVDMCEACFEAAVQYDAAEAAISAAGLDAPTSPANDVYFIGPSDEPDEMELRWLEGR